MAWTIPARQGEAGFTWGMRIFSTLCLVMPIFTMIWLHRLPDLAPGFLAKMRGGPAERDGLHFVCKMEVEDSRGCMVVYYQNRYNRPCDAKISLRVQPSLFKDTEMPKFTFNISAEGGEYGKQSMVWAIPRILQGKKANWDITAEIKYPKGRGTLLIGRSGLETGRTSFTIRHGSVFVQITTPTGVDNFLTQPAELQSKILWKMGDPLPA